MKDQITRFHGSSSVLPAMAAFSAFVGFQFSGASAFGAALEEVVVTAQKREESLQDVPVAIQAIQGETIEDLGIGRLEDLTKYTPTVTITQGTGDDQIFVRGVGSGVNKGFEQSVGLYIDGLYFGRGRSTQVAFLDLARVEVLKGPQGILFGKNTIAGALNITSRSPGEETEGYVNTSYNFETKEQFVEGAYGGPLTDTFGARLAVRWSDMKGWMDNTWTGDDMQDNDNKLARLSTVWDPSDTLSVIGKFQYSDMQWGERPAELSKCSAATKAKVGDTDDCKFNGTSSLFAENPEGDGQGEEKLKAYSAGITVNWELEDFTLTSVTGYIDHDDNFFLDVDYTHFDDLSSVRNEDYHNFSQELRIASAGDGDFDYLAGLYYENNELNVFQNFFLREFAGGVSRTIPTTQKGESMAAFGQVKWHINEAFALTVGGRYSDDQKDIDQQLWFSEYKTKNRLPIESLGALGTVYDLSESRSDDDFSPSVLLEWTPTDNHMLYAKYSQGFKAGGFDMALSSGDKSQFAFDPEDVDSYEIGSKSTLFDGAMNLNLAVYRNEYSNLQVSTFDGVAGFNVGNAAKSISQGADVELNWALTDELTSTLVVSYLDATYDDFPNGQCPVPLVAQTPPGEVCVLDLSGEDLQFAPEWSGYFNLTWERPVSDNLLVTVSTDVTYSDSYYVAADLDPNLQQDSFYKLDLRLALGSDWGDWGWQVAVVGTNLNDEDTFHWGNDVPLAPGSYFKHLDPGRTYALQGRVWF